MPGATSEGAQIHHHARACAGVDVTWQGGDAPKVVTLSRWLRSEVRGTALQALGGSQNDAQVLSDMEHRHMHKQAQPGLQSVTSRCKAQAEEMGRRNVE